MNILLVTADPTGRSFAASLAENYVAGVQAAVSASVEHADLAQEGFDPRMTSADLAFFRGEGTLPEDVALEQARIERADLILIAFPVYWWSMPAVLKGWVDRVFTRGWAFGDDKHFSGRLVGKSVRLVATGGAGQRTYEKHGYRAAIAAQIEHGVFKFSGVGDVETHLFLDVESGDRAARLCNLSTAQELGRTLAVTRRPAAVLAA